MTATTKPLPRRLPSSDAFGNYWLGEKINCAAIFKSGRKGYISRYFASLGDLDEDFGLLTDDGGLRYFDTPEAALKALRKEPGNITLSFKGG